MGNPDEGAKFSDYERPVHKVSLSHYYIFKYEVTQGLWYEVMGASPSELKGSEYMPVENISWYDCIEFCNRLSERDGLQKVYIIDKEWRDVDIVKKNDGINWTVSIDDSANGYRLPTEAQWEFASRGGNESKGHKYSGSNNVGWGFECVF